MQTSSRVLMIRPVNFGYNAETAVNNSFQKVGADTHVQQKALQEFNRMVDLIKQEDVEVLVLEDLSSPYTPDSIFPNNWISFHEDGIICLYPMFAANRRLERKPEFLTQLSRRFSIRKILDLTPYETSGKFLEGTGSLVLDRDNRIAYACISERTHNEVLDEFCRQMNYKAVIFHATDSKGLAIYHTNVMMSLAEEYAVVCFESIHDEDEKQRLRESIINSRKQIVNISMKQMNCFAGNVLQLHNSRQEKILLMSSKAYASFEKTQLDTLNRFNKIVHCDLDTIETNGGGSARCMVAEIFCEPAQINQHDN